MAVWHQWSYVWPQVTIEAKDQQLQQSDSASPHVWSGDMGPEEKRRALLVQTEMMIRWVMNLLLREQQTMKMCDSWQELRAQKSWETSAL